MSSVGHLPQTLAGRAEGFFGSAGSFGPPTAVVDAIFGQPNLIVFSSGNDVSPTAGTTDTIAGGNGRQIQFALLLEL